MFRFEFAKFSLGVQAVDVDDEDTRDRTGGDGNIECRLVVPPRPDSVRVRGGILEAVGRGRPLGTWLTWEDLQSLPGICQRGADHGSVHFQRNASGRSSPKSASAYASTGDVSAGIGAGVAPGRAANGNVPCGRRMRMQGTVLGPICVTVG